MLIPKLDSVKNIKEENKFGKKIIKMVSSIKHKSLKKYVLVLTELIMFQRKVMRERINESLKLMKTKIYRGDLHMHSVYSGDGIGTVKEMKQYIDIIGLDFAFITDHHTTMQKFSCRKFKNLWWGQESGSGLHHLAMLNLDKTFKMTGDFIKDYKEVERLGGFAFIAHPTGWFYGKMYNKEQVSALCNIGDKFAMEIVNGANNLCGAYDVNDEIAIKMWDILLLKGKEVTGLGNSDAHLPQSLGDIWTGVICDKLNKKEVLNGLRKGRVFVSEAPLIILKTEKCSMGDKLYLKKGVRFKLTIKCADSFGLSAVSLIKNGKKFKEYKLNNEKVFKIDINDKFNGFNAYYRAECVSKDFMKAWSNPIYIRKS